MRVNSKRGRGELDISAITIEKSSSIAKLAKLSKRTNLLREHVPLELRQVLHRPDVVFPFLCPAVLLAIPAERNVSDRPCVEQFGCMPRDLLVLKFDPTLHESVLLVLRRTGFGGGRFRSDKVDPPDFAVRGQDMLDFRRAHAGRYARQVDNACLVNFGVVRFEVVKLQDFRDRVEWFVRVTDIVESIIFIDLVAVGSFCAIGNG